MVSTYLYEPGSEELKLAYCLCHLAFPCPHSSPRDTCCLHSSPSLPHELSIPPLFLCFSVIHC